MFCTCTHALKGQCHEIFDFWFFSWISFPQALECTITAILNFFENSRRYSRLKVHHRCRWHRWQMEKIFNQKIFNYFFRTSLGSRVNIYKNFCLQVHFKVSAAWYSCHYLPPVANLPPRGDVDTGGQFATGVVDTSGKNGGKICRRCRWYRWCTFTCEYLREFSKKFEMVLMGYSGAGGKLIHEKNQKQKISWHCPFNMQLTIYTVNLGPWITENEKKEETYPNIYKTATNMQFQHFLAESLQ